MQESQRQDAEMIRNFFTSESYEDMKRNYTWNWIRVINQLSSRRGDKP